MAVVTVAEGKLKGGEAVTPTGVKYHEFLCVPYAKPPVGDLRFKSPQPPESWGSERDATKSDVGNISCQLNLFNQQFIGSEDCLYLNIYTPKLPSSDVAPLPVMVFIHGGAFVLGNGIIKSELGPDFLLENDVVVVTINYRLGVLGFLSLDIPEAAGNMGLKDQVRALKWIQENIDKFGGDKHNVTIFGVSAGSASVDYLILSPTAKGLFHKAILQSGSSLSDWAINHRTHEVTSKLLEKLDYKGDTGNTRAAYKFLLGVPAPLLTKTAFQVAQEFPTKSVLLGFVPVVEKDIGDAFLTSTPYKLLKEGRFNKVPAIRGFCNREGTLKYMYKPEDLNELAEKRNFVDYLSFNLEGQKRKFNTDFSSAYQKRSEDEDFDLTAFDFFGDLHFCAGTWIAALLQARHGVPIRFYQFAYDGNINLNKVLYNSKVKKGAGHGDDQTYLLTNDMVKVEPDETDNRVRQILIKLWTNFAKTGEPSYSEFKVDWPRFTEESKAYLVMDRDAHVATNYESQRMEVFEEIYAKYA